MTNDNKKKLSLTLRPAMIHENLIIAEEYNKFKDYEHDVLYPLAGKKVEIDLDDGVKHNYPLFAKALKKVTGFTPMRDITLIRNRSGAHATTT